MPYLGRSYNSQNKPQRSNTPVRGEAQAVGDSNLCTNGRVAERSTSPKGQAHPEENCVVGLAAQMEIFSEYRFEWGRGTDRAVSEWFACLEIETLRHRS